MTQHKKTPSQMPLSLSFVDYVLLSEGLALNSSLFAQWNSLGENQIFIWKCLLLEIAPELGMWASVHFFQL